MTSLRHSLLAVTLVASISAVAGAAPPELVRVPQPAAGTVEASVLEEVETAHGAVESLRRGGADDAELARGYGTLGELYAAYEMWDGARAALRNARALDPDSFPWAHLLGYVEARRGELGAAEEALAAAAKLRPEELAVWIRLGEARLGRHRVAEARTAFERALDVDPGSAAAHFGLGRAFAAAGDDAGAVRHLERALDLQPGASQIRTPLALAYRRTGRVEKARELLAGHGEGRVSFDDPLVAELASRAGGGAFHKFEGDGAALAGRYGEAAAAYRRAVAADPENFYYRKSLGLTLHQLGRAGEAAQQLEAAARLLPEIPDAQRRRETVEVRFSLAGLAANRGDLEAAAEHFAAVVEADPDYLPAHLHLGNLAGRDGRREEALGHFRRALEIDPDHPGAVLQTATTLMDLGRFGEAVPLLEKKLHLDPADRRARQLLEIARDRAGG